MCWVHCPEWCSIAGSILLWASGRGDFSLRANMGSDSIPQKLSDEIINRGLVCAYIHSIARTQSKDPDIHILDRWMPAKKTKTKKKAHPACTIHADGMWLPLWFDYKTVTCAKISPKMVNPKDIAGNAKEEETDRQTSTLKISFLNLPTISIHWKLFIWSFCPADYLDKIFILFRNCTIFMILIVFYSRNS